MRTSRLISIILLLSLIIVLNACRTVKIIDLVNVETNEFSVFDESDIDSIVDEQYIVNGVVFIPYIAQEHGEKYGIYSLRLACYKLATNESNVSINSVGIKGNESINVSNSIIDTNYKSEFSVNEQNTKYEYFDVILIEEVNEYDMEINEKSVLQVTLNISVVQNGSKYNEELGYEFIPKIRKYIQQR